MPGGVYNAAGSADLREKRQRCVVGLVRLVFLCGVGVDEILQILNPGVKGRHEQVKSVYFGVCCVDAAAFRPVERIGAACFCVFTEQ